MKKKLVIIFSGIGLLTMVFLMLDVSVVFWDIFFLIGLVIFMLGGVFLLLEKGVFDFFFYSFKKFLKTSSKVEEYVAEVNGQGEFALSAAKTATFSRYILLIGITIIVVTTILSVYLF